MRTEIYMNETDSVVYPLCFPVVYAVSKELWIMDLNFQVIKTFSFDEFMRMEFVVG